MGRKQGKIFNVWLNSALKEEVLAYVKYRIKTGKKFCIVTPNPEIVLASTQDKKLELALNKADLALPDGVGLSIAGRFLGLKPLNVLPGRKVFQDLISLAEKNSWRVFLLGGEADVSGRAAGKLMKKYKKIEFEWADGPRINKSGLPDTQIDSMIQKVCVEKINKFKPHLLFIALGPTKQEKWMINNLPHLNVGGAMTVGGTFNYIAGVSPVPPKWMEKAGLEWGWRLITEPWRIGRIVNAVIIFPWKVFLYKMSKSTNLQIYK